MNVQNMGMGWADVGRQSEVPVTHCFDKKYASAATAHAAPAPPMHEAFTSAGSSARVRSTTAGGAVWRVASASSSATALRPSCSAFADLPRPAVFLRAGNPECS